MTDRDEKLARLYRALAKEEPPPALDAAILAASRRAVARPSLARRWAVPVSVAAVLVLAIGLTLEMRDEAPGIESPTASPPPMREDRAAPSIPVAPEAKPAIPEPRPAPSPATRAAPAQERPKFVPEPKRREFVPEPKREESIAAPPRPQVPAAPAPAMQPPPAASNVAPAQSAARPAAQADTASAAKRLAAPAAAAPAEAGAAAARAAPDPVASLEAIAKLRAAGRDDEADRALEEFRRRFPGYRIDAATWERVRRR